MTTDTEKTAHELSDIAIDTLTMIKHMARRHDEADVRKFVGGTAAGLVAFVIDAHGTESARTLINCLTRMLDKAEERRAATRH